jgi:CII-binding regulator of phage lambda lysogenization HflD
METLALTVDLGVKLKQQNSRPWDVPKTEVAGPWHQWLLELTLILLKPTPGRKRAVFDMSRNHLHLGVEALTKTLLHRSNGKVKISNTHRHTLNGMVPQTVSKTTQGEITAILDGVEHRTVQSASQELVDISTFVTLCITNVYSLLFSAGH